MSSPFHYTPPALLTPTSVAEAADLIREAGARRVLFMGSGTKWDSAHRQQFERLTAQAPAEPPLIVSSRALTGILEYDPAELTITACAGTPLAEVVAALAQHGQNLPFDPIFAAAGATLGGTLAAGLSGPRRLRYGGLRDFVLGILYLDPNGVVIRGGGKVVKNAAGYDLPKLFCGSMGALGLITEVSFKVFPAPQGRLTLIGGLGSAEQVTQALIRLAASPAEISAAEAWPSATLPPDLYGGLSDAPYTLAVLIEGASDSLMPRAAAVEQTLALASPLKIHEADAALWTHLRDLMWIGDEPTIVRIYHAPAQTAVVDRLLAAHSARRVITAGGNATWAAFNGVPSALSADLLRLDLTAAVWRSALPSLDVLPNQPGLAMAQRVKHAFDPDGRFYLSPTLALDGVTT